ncbi:MAG: VOC family protein [Propionibacteriaceae bacterium]|nr:VOC family protein [Propionibacteriaceae bacterium]
MDEYRADETELPRSVVPYLVVSGGAEALSFYASAMGAVENNRMTNDDGTLGHAEFMIGAARFYLADEWPVMGVRSPMSLGGNSVSLSIEVDDAPAWVQRASAAGARVERPVTPGPEDGFESGWIVDPFGHRWHLTSRLPT